MPLDPIIAELHRQRAEEMERFNYDFDAFCDALREKEKLEKEPVIPPPAPGSRPRLPQARPARRKP